MREIKFRAWDKKNKLMIPFTENYICEEYSSICWTPPEGDWNGIGNLPGSYGNLADSDEISEMYELMQYTGLKDKNGVEIYEGDIVKMPYNDEFVLGKVRWDFAKVGFICVSSDYEVIGNIYESPELLTAPIKEKK